MGTRYEDQPVEQWAGPESLDPTPVWKQYVLVAALLAAGLIVVLIAAVPALAPSFVTPPALVFGDRLVLSAADVPPVGALPKLITSPVIDGERSFFLVQPQKGQVLALRAHWRPRPAEPECVIGLQTTGGARLEATNCAVVAPTAYVFDPLTGAARVSARFDSSPPRSLDQYLVSVSGDRVIVNLSRVIESSERTSGPVPTGIPQPQTQTP